jgi:glucose/mannose transport system substrate-binding protein
MSGLRHGPIGRRALIAGAAAAAFCSPLGARAQRLEAEVVHWWTAGSESDAIRSLRRRFEAGGPAWIDTPVQGPDLAKTAALTRILGGRPPAVMLWHVGPDLPQLVRDGVIRDIDAVAVAEGWDALLPKTISDRLKVDGKYVAAPVDLHGANWTFANLKLLKAAGIGVPETWPQVIEACQALKSSGVIPIAFSGQPWQEALVFIQVIAGTGGANLIRRFTTDHDPTAAESPEMVASFEMFARLKPFVDKASPNRNYTDTASLVSTDRAALYFSGDWSRGELNKAGMRNGLDYACRLAPGNDGIFLAVVDAFCMPRSVPKALAPLQDAFARLTMSLEAQHEFNLLKGSIPLRPDVDLNGYDACSQLAARLTRGGGEVLASASLGMTTAMRGAFYDVIHRFWFADDANPKVAARDLRIAIERNRA